MCAPFCIHQKRDRPYFYGGMDLDVVLKIPWDFIPAVNCCYAPDASRLRAVGAVAQPAT